MSEALWNPIDWSYFAEGGKHVIFQYRLRRGHQPSPSHGDDDVNEGDIPTHHSFASNTDRFIGHVLRIRKSDLVMVSHLLGPTKFSEHDDDDEGETSPHTFQRCIVQPLLGGCYIDLPVTIILPNSFCKQLCQTTITSGVIPSSRLPSWSIDDTTKKSVDGGCQGVKATLLRDHTQLVPYPITSSQLATNTNKYTIMSVEIKPKAGYLATSPFVLPAHRCKYYRTRYSLQQELMEKGHVQKGWNRKNRNILSGSKYCPLDLFSGNLIRTIQAVTEMSLNMQNNFRVWCNGSLMFEEYETPTDQSCQKILNNLFGNNTGMADAKSILLRVIVDIVAKVLINEPVLNNLQQMQMRDVIDGDGATLVYERLVQLCGGSQADAERLLDEARWDLLLQSPPYITSECPYLQQLMNEIQQFQSHLRSTLQAKRVVDEHVADDSHSKCIEYVSQLSKEACIYLLHNWLLSLAMCDVSFFVTFRVLTEAEVNELSHIDGIRESCQTVDTGGIAVCPLEPDLSTKMVVHYEVKCVDCDPKPAKKLRHRRDVESKFQFIQSQYQT